MLGPRLLGVVVASAGLINAQVNLGTALSFGVLGGSTVTNTGPTVVDGDVGVSPGSAIVGFPPGTLTNGVLHAADAVALQAQTDIVTAYNAAAAQAPTQDLTGSDLGGLTLVAGVYNFDISAQLTTELTLDGQGNPDSVWIFQIGTTLTTATGSSVTLINGANFCNIFWQIGSSATLGTDTTFAGNILALQSITLVTGTTSIGGLFARNGAVTLDTNTIISPRDCPGGGTTATGTGTATQTGTSATGGGPPVDSTATGTDTAATESPGTDTDTGGAIPPTGTADTTLDTTMTGAATVPTGSGMTLTTTTGLGTAETLTTGSGAESISTANTARTSSIMTGPMFPDRPMRDFSIITIAFRTVCLISPEGLNGQGQVYYVKTPCTKTTVLTAPTAGYDSDDIYSKDDQKSCNDECHRKPGKPGTELDRGSGQAEGLENSPKNDHKDVHKADLDGSKHGLNHGPDHKADHQTDDIRPQITEVFGPEDVVTAVATVNWPRKAVYGLVGVFPVVVLGMFI